MKNSPSVLVNSAAVVVSVHVRLTNRHRKLNSNSSVTEYSPAVTVSSSESMNSLAAVVSRIWSLPTNIVGPTTLIKKSSPFSSSVVFLTIKVDLFSLSNVHITFSIGPIFTTPLVATRSVPSSQVADTCLHVASGSVSDTV